MKIEEFKKLLDTNRINPIMLRDAHYLKKRPDEIRKAFETLIKEFDIKQIKSLDQITTANRRGLVIQELIQQIRSSK